MRNLCSFVLSTFALLHVIITVAGATACTSYYQNGCFLQCDTGNECLCEIKSGLNYTSCNQHCDKQNVTQCPTMKCTGGDCQQYCKGKAKCMMACSGSQCTQECLGGGCDHITCSSSECTQTCSNCTMECTSSVKKCRQFCVGGKCHLKCLAADCKPECSRGACTYNGGAAVKSGYTAAVVTGLISIMFLTMM